jgi:hypothetical protein
VKRENGVSPAIWRGKSLSPATKRIFSTPFYLSFLRYLLSVSRTPVLQPPRSSSAPLTPPPAAQRRPA